MLRLVISLLLFTSVSTSLTRNLYKVVLTQKRSIQFIEFEVDVPILEEFTFCVWVKPYDLKRDQPFFHYLVGDSDRIISLWLEEGGGNLKIKFWDKITSASVDWSENIWRHVCLTWNSNLGLWAVYADDELLMCDAAEFAFRRRITGGGRLILGYGTTERGIRHGLRGELFGFNMILASTFQNANGLNLKQKKSKTIDKAERITKFEKVVFDNLETKKKKKYSAKLATPILKNVVRLEPIDYDYGDMSGDVEMELPKDEKRNIKQIESIEMFETTPPAIFTQANKFSENYDTVRNLTLLWKIINDSGLMGKLTRVNDVEEQILSATRNTPTLSEFETPPPLSAVSSSNFDVNPSITLETNFNVNNGMLPEEHVKSSFNTPSTFMSPVSINFDTPTPVDYEVPPPPQKNEKVFGHWSSGSFPKLVLDYLKTQNVQLKNSNSIPPTINQNKYSDSYPYPSEQVDYVIAPPLFVPHQIVEYEKRIYKRETRGKEFNVRIIENDVRKFILDQHQNHRAENVEITHRGDRTENEIQSKLYYKKIVPQTNYKELTVPKRIQIPDETIDDENYKEMEYTFSSSFPEDDIYGGVHYSQNIDNIPYEVAYAKKFYTGNKWHSLDSMYNKNRSDYFQQPYEKYNQKQMKTNKNIAIAYEIAKIYSGDSEGLPTNQHNKFKKINVKHELPIQMKDTNSNHKLDTFKKPVKLGNTLNERDIIGENRARSFVGGDDKVPELNKYRSDIDKVNITTPPSLEPRVCKQQNPQHGNSPALQLVQISYKKCTQTFKLIAPNLVGWNKTPIRFFGGIKAAEARRKCGYF